MFEQRCFHDIGRIGSENFLGNSEVRCKVPGPRV